MGQMSLVGPRPSLRLEIAEMGSHGEERLRVKPGITGLCQISGRANLPYERCVELERLYIEHASIRLDLWILWKTLSVAVRKVGAH